ncbi:MAG: hypothetical protein K2F75_06360, partial [Paramuribaculum sp.]|nr:hypothetical protein [Paramuribaculum sp.]
WSISSSGFMECWISSKVDMNGEILLQNYKKTCYNTVFICNFENYMVPGREKSAPRLVPSHA